MIISPAQKLDSVSTYYFATKLKQIASMDQDGGDKIINLGIGSPDLLPPDLVVKTIQSAASEPLANTYQSYTGLPVLRKAFSLWYHRHFNVVLNSDDEVLPLIGSKEGIMHISMAFLNPGDEVLVPNPGYPAYSAVTKLAGGKVVNYDLLEHNEWLPDLEKLAKSDLSKVKIMWLNYPHMPTGAVANLSFFTALIDFAKAHKILLCHDNPYAFILNEHPLSLLSIPGAKDVAIELTSLSKCYNMAGWRVGAVVGKAAYLKAILSFKSNMDSGMYKPIQKAAVEALSLDKSWFDMINKAYKKRREIAFQIMESLECDYNLNRVGLFVWGKVKSGESAESYSDEILLSTRVFITPGHIFGSNGDDYLRISLCSPVNQLQDALEKIQKFKNTQS